MSAFQQATAFSHVLHVIHCAVLLGGRQHARTTATIHPWCWYQVSSLTCLWEGGPLTVLLHACAHPRVFQDIDCGVGGTHSGQDLADRVAEATLWCLGVSQERGFHEPHCLAQEKVPVIDLAGRVTTLLYLAQEA